MGQDRRFGWVLLACIAAGAAGCAAHAGGGGIVIQPAPVVLSAPAPAAVDIPKGHYPPPGSCRIWLPGVPPGQQSPPGNCAELSRRVPPGAVLVGR